MSHSRTRSPARSAAYWILDRKQIQCLSSSRRQDMVDRLAGDGPLSVRELARAIGMKPSAIYHHLEQLLAVGLVIESGHRTVNRRQEKLYATLSEDASATGPGGTSLPGPDHPIGHRSLPSGGAGFRHRNPTSGGGDRGSTAQSRFLPRPRRPSPGRLGPDQSTPRSHRRTPVGATPGGCPAHFTCMDARPHSPARERAGRPLGQEIAHETRVVLPCPAARRARHRR